ncbi:hypothetical protein Cni_G01756 [Canna indica]|uniref:DYW domain-containing protein n=1 Tax=Canna indica TaxID=4628 RepID=A0AAQ3JN74_9LILI|nr:hypothetical protein Cni_G01756 [Canna indica]
MHRPFARRLTSFALQPHLTASSNPSYLPRDHAIVLRPHVKPGLHLPILLNQLPVQHRRLPDEIRPRSATPARTSPNTSTKEPGDEHDSAYEHLVRRYMGSCDPCDAQSLHLELIKRGFDKALFLSNNLVNLYAKAGDLACARKLFDQMPERNAVSWTCLISGYTQRGFCDTACQLFQSMIRSGLEPTHFTFASVLRACGDSGPDRLFLGTQIHGLISKSFYWTNTLVCNALISMYGGCRLDSAWDARRMFDETHDKNLVTWNSIISVLSERGDAFSAFELLARMQTRSSGCSLRPNEFTFGSLITATYCCSYGGSILEQMLANVYKSGFSKTLYVGSALVSAFARLGFLEKAKEIFEEMDEKNAVSMNGLMVALIKQSLGEEALDVYREATGLVITNIDTYVVLLSALSEFSNLEEGVRKGREIHSHVIRNGIIVAKVAIGNGLINMYAKCGAIDDAAKVFDQLSMKDQVSWNTMISGLDQNGLSEESLTSFHLMIRNGILPSNFSIISTLSSCSRLRLLSAGIQVHCIGVKLGLDMDVSVSNSLLAMYGECGRIPECQRVFSYMTMYDRISWNSMIGALANNEASLAESVGTLLDMTRSGWRPNKVTILNVFTALSALSDLEMCRQVHSLVLKHGMHGDIVVENALLSSYAKSGDMNSCQSVFLSMADRRNDVSWNSMISGYIQNGLMQKAMDFVWFMIHSGFKMDCFTFATVLSACASVAALERGMELHAFGIRSHSEIDVVVGSALVDMYAKCGRIDYASKVFESMNVRNEFSWNSMISGYARHGIADEALRLFKEMQSWGQCPDLVTFVGILSACSHAGLVEEGLEHFESIENYGLVPQMEHYSCVIDLLGRTSKLDEMEDFIKRMPVKPNNLIWRTVLVACCRSKDGAKRDISRQASEMLLELEPENPVNYVLVSNMYASRGKWEDVAKARKSIRTLSAKKEAGCSWVMSQDGLHVFVAGDRSHPNTKEIYAKLNFLIQKIRDLGYVPQAELALYDIELETKEELLSYHSEKLAVAFALMRSSTVPIHSIILRMVDVHVEIFGRNVAYYDFGIFSDPEFQCKRWVTSYKAYAVEGKVKGSLSRSFRLVNKINSSIGQDPDSKILIGVLDIYGFESFKTERCLTDVCFSFYL